MNLRKFFLYTLIISVVVSALLGIGVVLFGDFGYIEVRVLMTTFTITLTSILGYRRVGTTSTMLKECCVRVIYTIGIERSRKENHHEFTRINTKQAELFV